MKRISRMLPLLALLLSTLLGCQSEPNACAVAIVDLDEVAKQMQCDTKIAADVQQTKAELETKLNELRTQLQQQFDQRAKLLTGDEAADDPRKRELATFKQQLDGQLAHGRQQAESQLALRRQKLVNDFRDEIKPVAQRVATRRGSRVVVTKNDAVVFAFSPQADITHAVVAELQQRR